LHQRYNGSFGPLLAGNYAAVQLAGKRARERSGLGRVWSLMKNELEHHVESLSGPIAIEKIRDLAKSAGVCLFGTDLKNPPLTVRPMAVQSVDDSGHIWFLSGRSSHTNQHIAADSQVQLLFANPGSSEFMTLEGEATISDDRRLKEEHWTPIAKTWFNEGVNDPELTVLKVRVRDGYYWDTKHGKTTSMVKIAIGTVTGKTLDDSIEGRVKL
jgi:general stress protein 26